MRPRNLCVLQAVTPAGWMVALSAWAPWCQGHAWDWELLLLAEPAPLALTLANWVQKAYSNSDGNPL